MGTGSISHGSEATPTHMGDSLQAGEILLRLHRFGCYFCSFNKLNCSLVPKLPVTARKV